MAPIIKNVRGFTPQWGQDCFIADNASIIGDVVLGDRCTVWFNAVIRGDVHSIRIGDDTNIQDAAIIHATYQKAKTTIGSKVSVAHRAIVHGCTIEDKVLVGMGAIIMDHALIKTGSVIAAGAVILPGTVVERHSTMAGVPARCVKQTGEHMLEVIEATARNYPMYARWYDEDVKP